MKICKQCGIEKDRSEFYKSKGMTDGIVNKCKDCTKQGVRDNREKNIAYYTQYEKSRAKEPHRVKARYEYAQTANGKDRGNSAKKRWENDNPIKKGASTMVGNAIRDEKLFKEPCEICGAYDPIHAHHDDYAKPLNVRWLCSAHHSQWHRDNGEGINGG